MAHYPSVPEALAHPIQISPEVKMALKDWKNAYWKGWRELENGVQKILLVELLRILSFVQTREYRLKFKSGAEYSYSPLTQTISFGPIASLISSLHELSHSIYGANELDACAFSLQLFKEVFPKDFAKLKVKGHMLVKEL